MSRFLSSSMEYYSGLTQVAFRVLADITVTSATVYCCTGRQFIYARANTYSPVGNLGGIDNVQEESDPFPRTLRLWGSAINSAALYEPLRQSMYGRPMVLYRAFLDPDTLQAVNTPEPMYNGYCNGMTLKFNDPNKGNYYEIEYVNELHKRPAAAYFNHQTLYAQSAADSGSIFYDFQYLIPGYKSQWGQQASAPLFPAGYVAPSYPGLPPGFTFPGFP